MFCSLGKRLGVPTPACEAFVRMGSLISGVDYLARGMRTLDAMGLGGLSVDELKAFLETGEVRSA